MSVRTGLLVVAAALLAAGCMTKEQRLVGSWRAPGAVLTLNKDKTFTLNGYGVAIGGTWALEQERVALTAVNINGKPKEQVLKEAEQQAAWMGAASDPRMNQAKAQAEAWSGKVMLTHSADLSSLDLELPGWNERITFKRPEKEG